MKNLVPLTIALGIGILVSASYSAGLFAGLEYFFEDLLFSPKAIHPDIVIIGIDNASLQKIGQWPWPRKIFADVLAKLKESQPQALGLDILLAEPSRYGQGDDAALAKTISSLPYPITLPAEAEAITITDGQAKTNSTTLPLELFLKNTQIKIGHINVIQDRDNTIRSFTQKIIIPEGQTYPSFAHSIINNLGKDEPSAKNPLETQRIVYAGPPGTIRTIPFWRLYYQKELLPDLKNKIIFIGVTAPDLHDTKRTPVSRGSDMTGVEVHAQIFNMLLQGYQLESLNPRGMTAIIVILALIPGLFFFTFKKIQGPLTLTGAVGIAYIISAIVLFEKGVAINMVHGIFSVALSATAQFGLRYLTTEKERRHIRELFGKHISPHILNEILKNPKKVALGGEERDITILFCDIRGFTTLSEQTKPKELLDILNQHFELMGQEIVRHDGVLDKYIGDAIMAFWGAPLNDPQQANHAIEAALSMLNQLKKLNTLLNAQGLTSINIGIGIYSGPAVAGYIGSSHLMSYTVVGDTVNTASRLEGINKEYKTSIMIGETTKKLATKYFGFKELGEVIVKGKNKAIKIYTIG